MVEAKDCKTWGSQKSGGKPVSPMGGASRIDPAEGARAEGHSEEERRLTISSARAFDISLGPWGGDKDGSEAFENLSLSKGWDSPMHNASAASEEKAHRPHRSSKDANKGDILQFATGDDGLEDSALWAAPRSPVLSLRQPRSDRSREDRTRARSPIRALPRAPLFSVLSDSCDGESDRQLDGLVPANEDDSDNECGWTVKGLKFYEGETISEEIRRDSSEDCSPFRGPLGPFC